MAKINGKFVPPNKIFLSDWQKQFVLNHFKEMNNDEIAAATGLSKTYVRMYAYSIGLQREFKVLWTPEQTKFFMDNWREIGNVELAETINRLYPSNKLFNKKTISKKMTMLKLKRNYNEEVAIRERNRLNGRWGSPIPDKKPAFVKSVWVTINPKLRIKLKPNQTPETVMEKFKHLAF